MTIDNSWQSNYLEVAKWRIKENRGSDRGLPEYAHEDRGSSIQELPSSGSSRIILIIPNLPLLSSPKRSKDWDHAYWISAAHIYDLEWKEGDELDK